MQIRHRSPKGPPGMGSNTRNNDGKNKMMRECDCGRRYPFYGAVFGVILGILLLYNLFRSEDESVIIPMESTVHVSTWNIAAINNNPFEYWITSDDPSYKVLMSSVQNFINDPGVHDVEVGQVFTPEMALNLQRHMQNMEWPGVEKAMAKYNKELKHRRIISGFMKDESIGAKRLVSMPDRVTNTIHLDSYEVHRPTVINCYDGRLDNLQTWWRLWQRFMFEDEHMFPKAEKKKKVAEMLGPISRFKYPALTEEEERISLALQTVVVAIFDSILVYMMDKVASSTWQGLRTTMCNKLNRNKVARTLSILGERYRDRDVIFIQEAASSFVLRATNDEKIGSEYHILAPQEMDPKRDQNSLIFLRRRSWQFDTVRELSHLITKELEAWAKMENKKLPVAKGDVFAISIRDNFGRPYVLASFHGDTNGLATLPVVTAVHTCISKLSGNYRLIFGLDANVYEKGSRKKQDMQEFVQAYKEMEMRSCWGSTPRSNNYTTYNARTYLQPQLNKAAKPSEMSTKGDKNPKDFIIFYARDFQEIRTMKDNTGDGKYVENMVFPTLSFPSDHAVLSTSLAILRDDDREETDP